MTNSSEVADELTTRFANWLCSSWPAPQRNRFGEATPKSVIIDEAEEWGADLIVVGSHGRTGIKRWLLGSVAQSIVSQAPCSVYVVRERSEKQARENLKPLRLQEEHFSGPRDQVSA